MIEQGDLLDEAADDFGHVVRCRPRAVLRPARVDDIVSVINMARRERIKVRGRGQGHSVFGQTQVEDGWVIDTRELGGVEIEGDTALVGAGATWTDVLRSTLTHGLAPSVLTDYLGLSVGGTLSVGGFGARSFEYGAQTDHVIELSAVTGAGEIRRCSAQRDPDLFDSLRAGLGQVGVITQAQLRLVRAKDMARHHRVECSSFEDLVDLLERLSEEKQLDEISAVGTIDNSGRWHFHIDAVQTFSAGEGQHDRDAFGNAPGQPETVTEAPYFEYATRLEAEVRSWRASGLWDAPHPWVDVLVPGSALLPLGRSILSSIAPDDLGVNEAAMVLIYPIATAPATTPLLPVPTSGGDIAYLFDVLRCVPNSAPARIQELLRHNRWVYEQALTVGGALYPISAVPMSSSDWRRHFGVHFDALSTAKRRYDPDSLFGQAIVGDVELGT